MRGSGRLAAGGLSSLLLLVAVGCGDSSQAQPHAGVEEARFTGALPVKIVCTTGMVADIVEHGGGDRVAVSAMMAEGTDPHLFKAGPGDISRLNEADAVFYSGLHLEGKMADVFVRMARQKPTFAVTERVDASRLLEVEGGHYDPHLWFDVSLWSSAVEVVADALAEFDPAGAEGYRSRAAAYGKELDALHEECRKKLAAIPRERRVLVTAHDAFGYFGRAYDIEVRAVQGVSTETEAGLQDINGLVDFLTERKIKAVFVESTVNKRNMRSLIESCEAGGHKVAEGGELFSDAMGRAGTPEGTYVGMVRHNVATIVRALK